MGSSTTRTRRTVIQPIVLFQIVFITLWCGFQTRLRNDRPGNFAEAFLARPSPRQSIPRRVLNNLRRIDYNPISYQTNIQSLPLQTTLLRMADDSAEEAAATTRRLGNVVVAGGGIVGTSVAYYLATEHASQLDSIALVDPTGAVGSCASGKAGGFLARDWRDGTELQELQRTGFDLHEKLAAELDTSERPIDYRRLTCAAVAVDESNSSRDGTSYAPPRRPNKPPSKKLIDLEWVDPGVVLWGDNDGESDAPSTGGGAVVPMGDEKTIAQVHPRKLCEALLNSVSDTVQLIDGRIVKAETDDDSKKRTVQSVTLEDGTQLPADVLVVACGPWSYEANDWFATDQHPHAVLPPVTAVKCHSILVPSARGQPNTQAVFFDSNGAIGAEGDLEVYPRPDGDSYVNGFANPEGVCTERPGREAVEDDKIQLLRSAMEFVEQNSSSSNGDSEKSSNSGDPVPVQRDHTQQVCYWPETPDGLPLIGRIPEIKGAYVAAGHSVWGILQGPATGKALAELIATGSSKTVDLKPFGIERYYL